MKKYDIQKIIIILFIMNLFIISGCQKTPEKQTVINKDDNILEDRISAPEVPKATSRPYSTPQNTEIQDNNFVSIKKWNDKISWDNSKKNMEVIVDIDAEIIYPNDISYPVDRIKAIPFTVCHAIKVKNAFMGEQDLYVNTLKKTKYDFLDDIIKFKSLIESTKRRADLTEEEKERKTKQFEGLIEYIESQIDSAPTTLPMTPAKIEFTRANSSSPDAEEINVCTSNDDRKTALLVFNTDYDKIYFLEWYIKGMPYYGEEVEVDIRRNKQILNTHLLLAQDKLKEIGVDYMALSAVGAISNGEQLPSENSMLNDKDLINTCFVFHFMRNVGGISSVYTYEMDGIGTETHGENYAPSYEDETIDILIDNSGVIKLTWKSPSELIKNENENVNTLSFEEIKEIFKKQILVSKVWSFPDSKKTIYIDRVEYGMTRIKIKNQKNEYRYVPSWTFFGHEENTLFTNEGSNTTTTKIPFSSYITINAIDGSIINRSLGY